MKIKFVILCLMSFWATCLFAGGEPGIPKALKKDFVLISNAKGKSDTQASAHKPFYISKNEVSNLEYRKFVEAMRLKGNADILKVIEVDTSVWYYNKPYAEHYATHAAFDDYPVVGISHAAAILYCQWLTETYGAGTMEFRLPSRAEWLLAARGTDTLKAYAWGKTKDAGSTLTDKRGKFRCNFFSWYGLENVHYNDSIKSYEFRSNSQYITLRRYLNKFHSYYEYGAPKGIFSKNPFGLYHLNGNVAEMVQEQGIAVGGGFRNTGYDVRNESTKVFTKPADDVGFRPVMVAVR
jgi:formylglycine-generating enzyme required for sulfatase activity